MKPDSTNYLAHFTSEGKPKSEDANNPGLAYGTMSAKEKLISILKSKKITASTMPWTSAYAVCFTECPWMSMIAHTQLYSPYGVGFKKDFVYSRNGGPVYYIRPDHFKEQMESKKFEKHIWPFLTPFVPKNAPKKMKDYFGGKIIDYTHEREWRVPHDFPFEYNNIEFVVLKDYSDMASFPQELKDAIGREKFILMENFIKIEELWPTHKF